jgi:HTH-type transcriptional regulator/antitoxin HigA
MRELTPAEVFPPGEFIREELEARGWSHSDLARIMDLPVRFVDELIARDKQISLEIAHGLAKAFGDDDPRYWVNLDVAYRAAQLERAPNP